MRRQDQLRWLGSLRDRSVPSTRELFGYHSVDGDWSVAHDNGLPEHLVYLVVAGSCAGSVAGRQVRLGAGSALWLRPRVPFALRATGGPLSIYRFRLSAMDAVDAVLPPALVVRNAWDLRPAFDALVSELGSALPFRDLRIRGLLLIVFTALFRHADRSDTGHVLDPARRRAVEEYADAHHTGRPTSDDLARTVGLSTDYFVRCFRHTFGMPPKEWLVRRRIQHAALRLDESTESITRTAAAFGYRDVALFSRQFKAVMGVSPRAYLSRSAPPHQ